LQAEREFREAEELANQIRDDEGVKLFECLEFQDKNHRDVSNVSPEEPPGVTPLPFVIHIFTPVGTNRQGSVFGIAFPRKKKMSETESEFERLLGQPHFFCGLICRAAISTIDSI
jgi:hypothetical protein